MHVLKKVNPMQFTEWKTGPVVFILLNFQNYRKLTNSLQTYFRVVLGLKLVDSNQPESGVFSHKLQFQSIRVDSRITRVRNCVRMGCSTRLYHLTPNILLSPLFYNQIIKEQFYNKINLIIQSLYFINSSFLAKPVFLY